MDHGKGLDKQRNTTNSVQSVDSPSLPFLLHSGPLQEQDQMAIETRERGYSYAEVDALSAVMGERLLHHGIQPGMRVLVVSKASTATVVLFLGMLRVGIVFAPASHRLPASQLADMVVQADIGFVISDDALLPSLSSLGISVLSLQTLWSETQGSVCRRTGAIWVPAQQPVTIVWTSGSTRQPKAAVHVYSNHYFSAMGSQDNIPLGSNDRWLLSLPLFHVAGIATVVRTMLAGATLVIPDDEGLSTSLLSFHPTHISMVPTQLFRLLEQGGEILQALQTAKVVLLGGSAVSTELWQTAIAHRLPVCVSYGSTEMSSQIATTRPGTVPDIWPTAGYVLPFREVRIAQDGEIWVRGVTLFLGYLQGSVWQRPFDEQGWFATGDLGQWCEDGSLRILGRKDAMFISGGENIQPEEIEWILEQHPAILRAVVVGVPDAQYGTRPHAFLQLKSGEKLEPQAIRTFLIPRIAKFKIPDQFHPWPEHLEQGMKISRKHLLASIV